MKKMLKKNSNIILKETDTVIEYLKTDFAIITNWQNPFTEDIHPDWRHQARAALSNPDTHQALAIRLARFTPFILVYTKLLFEQKFLLDLTGFKKATICVICSSGEHRITPWIIIHNIGHTVISQNIWVKGDIMKICGLTSHDDSIIPRQREFVDTHASRSGLIPNINELIYELFTTWVYNEHTKSDLPALAQYCDEIFPKLMDNTKNKMIWHKYRHPVLAQKPLPWLQNIIDNLPPQDKLFVPGVPGFTAKVLKKRVIF